MNSLKSPMSSSYKAIFVLSLLMIFFVIIGGAISGSKSVGVGVWYWGYTAWKMYKRDNASLLSLQKIMLWFQAVAFSVALAVLLFSDADVSRYVDITPEGLIALAFLSMGLTYGLYRYFQGQLKVVPERFFVTSSVDKISDKHWEQASRELEGGRHEATWAKSVSASEGDEPKAKALYLKLRATALQNAEYEGNLALAKEDITATSSSSKVNYAFLKRYGFIVVLLGLAGVIGYFSYETHKKSATVVIDGVTQKKFPLYRKLSDGESVRWNRDTECFIKMNLDFSNSINPVFLRRTSNVSGNRYKELTQEDRLIAVVYYDADVTDEVASKYLNKENFLSIKGMCEVNR